MENHILKSADRPPVSTFKVYHPLSLGHRANSGFRKYLEVGKGLKPSCPFDDGGYPGRELVLKEKECRVDASMLMLRKGKGRVVLKKKQEHAAVASITWHHRQCIEHDQERDGRTMSPQSAPFPPVSTFGSP